MRCHSVGCGMARLVLLPQYARWNIVRPSVSIDLSMVNENSSVILLAASESNTYTSKVNCVILSQFVRMLRHSFLGPRVCLCLSLLFSVALLSPLLSFLP